MCWSLQPTNAQSYCVIDTYTLPLAATLSLYASRCTQYGNERSLKAGGGSWVLKMPLNPP